MMNHANRAAVCVLSCIVALLAAGPVHAAPQTVRPESLPQGFVVIVEDLSKSASAGRPIYFASGANSWNPGDPDYVLSPRSDGRWQRVFKGHELGENVEFKFTLGSWKFVETDAEGQDIPNRHFPPVPASYLHTDEKPVIELTIPKFREGNDEYVIAPEYRPIEATGTVKRLQVAGGAGAAAGSMRDLLVWLPPGYQDHPDKAYPVLYMMDGQNLFQKPASAPGEWHLDETARAMITGGLIEPFIAVGIPNAGAARTEEYCPTMPDGVTLFGKTPAGDDFVAWLAREVMPRVERAFRTRTGPEHTAIGGSSAGGLIALYAGLRRPDLFGSVLAESPALELDMIKLSMTDRIESAQALPAKIYLGMGGAENLPGSGFYDKASQRHVHAAEHLRDAIGERADVMLCIVDRHEHNEKAWAERLPAALMFLYARDE